MEQKCKGLGNNIAEIVNSHGKGREYLLPILNEINIKYGHVGENSLIEISKEMDIPIGEIHGVLSFYSFLDHKKYGKYVIRLCRTISCELAKKDRIVKVLENELAIKFGETTVDNLFTLTYTNCIGQCDRGPAMLINDEVYGSLTPEKVFNILEKYREL